MTKGSESNPIVTISDGRLLGRKALTRSGKHYYTFKGIPFARPPVGELRFMAPEPPEPWDGVRDATFERSVCYQPRLIGWPMPKSLGEVWTLVRALPHIYRFTRVFSKQSEDCLYLNVFTPRLPTTDSGTNGLPVLFWIHGGAFLIGCGSEVYASMDEIVDCGIVVVTVNYRLGPFGFLSLDTDSAPGNAGLKDQVQALRWVQRNISKFCGDPNRVTIYGVSAGGVSSHLLTVSPAARGLFHRAIVGSGFGLCDWGVTTDHVKRAKEFARHLKLDAENPEELACALKKVSAVNIAKAIPKCVFDMETTLSGALFFTPSLERPGPGAFLSELPETILKEGRQAPVPLIAGVSLNEGALWYMASPNLSFEYLNMNRQKVMTRDLYDALPLNKRQEVANRIVEFYCGEKGLCKATEPAFIDIYGDTFFNVHFFLTCHLQASTSPAPVYMYRFCFDGRLGLSKKYLKGHPTEGPGHSDELGYIAPMQLEPQLQLHPGDREMKIRTRLTGLFTSFIKTGKPTFPSDENLDLVWNPITTKSMDYLEINDNIQMKHDMFGPRIQFWNELYKEFMEKPILMSSENHQSEEYQ